MSEPVISIRGLRKSYGSIEAVGGIDLEVRAGEVFAFLGPNGAGKTTTVEILEGYCERDGGEVDVLGVDPNAATGSWRGRLGVVLQTCHVQAELTVRESLELFAGYFPSPRSVHETIELVGLGPQRDQRAGRLSGGQQRRLDLGLALIGDPELLFLDEPTTGFDPAARRGAWEVIANLRELGKTVFLTTHYMDEAQTLADRVAIIADGQIVAEGTPAELGGRERAGTRIQFGLPVAVDPSELPEVIGDRVAVKGQRCELQSDSPVGDLAVLCGWAADRGIDLPGLEATAPRLEDLYLELTAEDVPVAGAE